MHKYLRLFALTNLQSVRNSTSFRAKGLALAAATVAICVGLFFFETSVANRVKRVDSAWVEFNRQAARADKALNEIVINFGYGGFIHNYKNYILRQNSELIPQINTNLATLYDGIQNYSRFPLTNREQKALHRLKRLLDLYQLKFKLAQSLVEQGKTVLQIDTDVQVNDSPAFDSIKFLANQNIKRYRQHELTTSRQLADVLHFQKTGRFVIIPLILLAGITLIGFLKKIVLTNEKIQQSRQQLYNMFESSPDAMLIVNRHGKITQVNKKVSQLFDYCDAELLGQAMEILVPNRLRKQHRKYWEATFKNDDQYIQNRNQEFSALKKDNIEISVEIGISFFGEASNKQAIVILRDVSEKKKAEEIIRKNQDVLNKAQKIAHLGSWEWDIVKNSFEWSDEIYRIFGLENTEHDVTYESFLERLPAGEKEEVVNAINASVVYDQPFKIEHRIIRPNGEVRFVQESGDVFRNNEDAPVHMVCSVLDITERKHAEVELQLADNVFNHTDEAIMITDANKNILRTNNAFTFISGYKEAEALGNRPDELLKSGQHDDIFYEELWEKLNKYGVWEGEIVDRRKNGELYPSWHNMSVVKDAHGDVIQYISIFSDISEKKRSEEYIRHLAQYDQLTGLPNRALFNDRLQHAISRAIRAKTNIGLMFIDLDRFKSINDSLGHHAGDRLLQIVAGRLSASVRSQDTVARLGGDEFTIVLEDLKQAQDAALIAEKLLSSLNQPIDIAEHSIIPGGSVGISIYPNDGADAESIIKHADMAMYQAKQQGRNCYQFYTVEFSLHAEQRFHLEKRLRYALENDELEVYYQPQINLHTGRIVGAEALIRWNDPVNGLILPKDFIPFAEESGLIEPIGIWVLETACAQAKSWQKPGSFPIRITVNVAGYQITHGNIVDATKNALQNSGLAPELLELEITEDFVMDYLDKGIEKLNALRQLGVSLAIDDFGTGYSSLSYLKRLPVDRLKIDRSFVIDMPMDKDDKAIVSTIIAMAKVLGLTVTAEGAEHEDHIQFLIEQGCDEAQGFYFCQPVPNREFIAYVTHEFNNEICKPSCPVHKKAV